MNVSDWISSEDLFESLTVFEIDWRAWLPMCFKRLKYPTCFVPSPDFCSAFAVMNRSKIWFVESKTTNIPQHNNVITHRSIYTRISFTFGERHRFIIQFGLLNEEVHQITHVLRIDQFVRIRFGGQTTKKLSSIVGLLRSDVELGGHTAFVCARCSSRTDCGELMKPSETLTNRWEQ